MPSSKVLFAAALLAISAMCVVASPCSDQTTCSSCTLASTGDCGWCATTNTCSQGTATGPNTGSCVSWDWLSSECPATPAPVPTPPGDNCAQYRQCYACTTDPPMGNCGWCASTNQCLEGTGSGPTSGKCASWDWVNTYCPATPVPNTPAPDHCPTFSDCVSCTGAGLPFCGWCASTGTCHQGTVNGPSSGTCARWDWVRSSCP